MPKTEFKLYQIHEGLGLLFDLIDDAESPLTPEEIGAKLKELYADQTELLDEVRKSILNFDSYAEQAKKESDRLHAMRQASEAKAAAMRSVVFRVLEESGQKSIKFKDGGFARIQANGQPSIVFTGDAEKLPVAYRQTIIHEPEYRIDREAILAADGVGIPLPAGVSVVKGSHLRLG